MTEAYLFAAVAILLLGAVCGFIALVSLSVHRDKDITAPPPSRVSRGARVASGLHSRGRGVLHEAAYKHDLPRRADHDW